MINKVTKLPIGLGMNHLEQEIAACHMWNNLIIAEKTPREWLRIYPPMSALFDQNKETGLSLENQGFIEVDASRENVRFTEKAIKLLVSFTDSEYAI